MQRRRIRNSDAHGGQPAEPQAQRKASNRNLVNPRDPAAQITKMKDGRTRLAYNAE